MCAHVQSYAQTNKRKFMYKHTHAYTHMRQTEGRRISVCMCDYEIFVLLSKIQNFVQTFGRSTVRSTCSLTVQSELIEII